jgi:hypothetical protein
MKSFAKGLVVVGALFGADATGLSAANAMTLAPVAAPSSSQSTPIETVGWRCGPGGHINPWGRCVPNHGGYRPGYGGPGYGGPGYGHRRPPPPHPMGPHPRPMGPPPPHGFPG